MQKDFAPSVELDFACVTFDDTSYPMAAWVAVMPDGRVMVKNYLREWPFGTADIQSRVQVLRLAHPREDEAQLAIFDYRRIANHPQMGARPSRKVGNRQA